MAKKKLNVKLLAVVFGLLGIGIVVLGGILLVQFRNDPVKHIRKADALMAEGNVNAALKQYGRGIGKAPYEMAYYDKMIDALEGMTPETRVEANSRFRTLLDLQIQRGENAADSSDKSAAENRDESTRDVLDNIGFLSFSADTRDLAKQVSIYESLADQLKGLDQAFSRVPTNERDPALVAAVRARVIEPLWRKNLLLTNNAWESALEEIVEASEIDPSYVPIQYGRLQGLLDRFDKAVAAGASDRAAKRLLDESGGFDQTLAEVRNAIGDKPAPEIEILEQSRNYIGFLAGIAGADDASVTPLPDAEAINTLSFDLGDVYDFDKRYRLELMRSLLSRMYMLVPTADVDPSLLSEFRIAVLQASRRAVAQAVAIDREDYRALIWAMILDLEMIGDLDRETLYEKVISAPPPKVGGNTLLSRATRDLATQSRFRLRVGDVAVSRSNETEMSQEELDRVEAAYQAILEAFPPSVDGRRDSRELQATLTFKAMMAAREKDDAKRAVLYGAAMRALNLIVDRDDSVFTSMALASAIEVAREFEQAGLALSLYQAAVAESPALQNDHAMRFQLALLLFDSGRLREAEAVMTLLADDMTRDEAAGLPVDDVLKTRIAMAVDNTAQINQGGVLKRFPGTEILSAEKEAMYVGDIAKRRELLDTILDRQSEFNPMIVEDAALRRAALEAGEGDFDQAKQYASLVLELNPDAQAAKLIMRSDASTSVIDRARIVSELSNSDVQDQEVAVIRMLTKYLLTDLTESEPEDVAMIIEERDRLLAGISAAEEKRPDAIRLLTERAMSDGRTEEANAYIDRLEEINGEPSSLTVVMRVNVLADADRTDEALAVIDQAIRTQGLGDDAMRGVYGDLLEKKGDMSGSLQQYEQAFEMAPTRPRNALKYAIALKRQGRDAEALDVLRLAKSEGRRSSAFLDLWLREEIRVGNNNIAIAERDRRRLLAPTDFKNAIALAQLLAQSPVGRADIKRLEDDPRRGFKAGDEIYDAARWARLRPAERSKIAQEYRAARVEYATRIFEELLALDALAPEIAVGASRFHNLRGERERADEILDQAETKLRRIVESGGNGIMLESEARNRLARILAEKGNVALQYDPVTGRERAVAYFDEAVEVESPFSPLADTVIVSILSGRGEMALAAKYQRRLLEEFIENDRAPRLRRDVARRLVEFLVGSGQVEEAGAIAAEYIDEGSSKPEDLLALGSLAFGRAIEMHGEGGDREEIESLLDEARGHYLEVVRIRGIDLDAAGRAATVSDYRWRWADEASADQRYQELVAERKAIVAADASSWRSRRALIEVLEKGLDFEAAMIELRSVLDVDPTNAEARLKLVDLLQRMGDTRQALEVAQTGFDRAPDDARWPAKIGRIRADRGEFDEAASQFGQLFENTRDPKYLDLQVRLLLARTPPAAEAVIGLARENSRYFSNDPNLIGAYSVALADAGKRAEALQRFESAYRLFKPKGVGQLNMLTRWASRLFPKTEDGVAALQLYIDEISGGSPGTVDLLELSVAWQQLAEDSSLSPKVREQSQLQAIEALRRASEAGSDARMTSIALLQLGVLLDKTDDCEGAIEAFERGLELRADDHGILNNLAYLGAQCGDDLQLALERSERAVEMRPSDPQYRDTLGAILLKIARRETDPDRREGRLRAAEQELLKAIKLGGQAYPWIHLAELRALDGDPEEARLALRNATDFDLNDEQKAEIEQVLSELDSQ